MKILMIVPYPIFPVDEGGRSRAYNLMKHLLARHEVVLLSPRMEGEPCIDLDVTVYETTPRGRRHQIFSPAFLWRAAQIIRRERPDLILSEYIWSGLHGALLAKAYGLPLVLDAPNVEGVRFLRSGSWFWLFIDGYERFVTTVARRVFAVCDEDRERFIGRGVDASKIEILPNGVDPTVIRPDAAAGASVRRNLAVADRTKLFLFFGQLNYSANREALWILNDEILPRLDRLVANSVLLVVGKGDPAVLRGIYRHPRFRFHGLVDSIAPYINAADRVLVPIRVGGGTRLKIIEAIACGVPVVSTSIGAEGIDRRVCDDLLTIADKWDDFAAAVVSDRVARREKPPPGFLETYGWSNIIDRAPF